MALLCNLLFWINLLENNKIVVAINIKCVYLLVNQFYNMHIVYKSKPMPIHIDEYEHNSFEYDKWIISDDYRELKLGLPEFGVMGIANSILTIYTPYV